MYEVGEVLRLINNLDVREKLRKFGSTWSVIVVNKNLEIEDIARFKNKPSIVEINEFMINHQDCVYFYSHPGMYNSIQKLEAKVSSCKDAFLV